MESLTLILMNKMLRDIVFNGSAGRIEAKYHLSSKSNAPAVLILHPHPLHGGTMNNKVVYNIFHTFVDNGFSALRFNFRGVGKSVGKFDHGEGELIDAAIALDWLQNNNPDASSYWIAGFSFGAWIGMQLLMRRPELSSFVVAAPPVTNYDFSFLSPCPAPGLIVQGKEDRIVNELDVETLYNKLSKQKNSLEIRYEVIKNADHFFTNKIDDFNKLLSEYIKDNMSSTNESKRIKKDKKRIQTIPSSIMFD